MDLHPNVTDPVMLRDHAGRQYRSEVEDLGAGLIVVAQPAHLPVDEAFESGTEVSVIWADLEGQVASIPTRILAVHARGKSYVWSLAATGPAVAEQRRRFERVAATGPVTIRPAEGREPANPGEEADDVEAESEDVPGSLIDVSEGALRCGIEAGAADRFLMGKPEVIVSFGFGAAEFEIPGRVEFLRPTRRPAELEELVVVFDEPVAGGDDLRKQIAAQSTRA